MAKKVFNNKGYMLIELILASAIAFAIAYFAINLTVRVKNKNDDLIVETVTATDQNIIANKLIEEAKKTNFNCNSVTVSGKNVKYGTTTLDIVNKYATVTKKGCTKTSDSIMINIGLSVPQLPNKNFDVVVRYKIS